MFIFQHMFFLIPPFSSPFLVLPYPRLPTGWAAVVVTAKFQGQRGYMLCCMPKCVHALVTAHECIQTLNLPKPLFVDGRFSEIV